MRKNNESIERVLSDIMAGDPKAHSNVLGILLPQVYRLNEIVDDLSKEVQELKRNKKRLINPITGERLNG